MNEIEIGLLVTSVYAFYLSIIIISQSATSGFVPHHRSYPEPLFLCLSCEIEVLNKENLLMVLLYFKYNYLYKQIH